jgi:multidrug resistance efflux pump
MIRRLKDYRAPDGFRDPPRPRSQRLIRWIYLACLLALAIWLGDLFLGGLLYFRSEGMVLAEPATVAAEFPVTVRKMAIREGQRVTAGTVATVVSSQNVVESIARLTADLATREARISELRIRTQTIDAITDVAESRQTAAVGARKEFEKLLDRGYLSLDKRTAAIESEFRSRQDLEGLKAEKRVIEGELELLGRAFAEAQTALNDLRRLYDNGKLAVPIDGIVSRVIADQGSVVRAGDPLIEVYGDKHFVLAYIPTGALYSVQPGEHVLIDTGWRTAEGVIVRVEPFAAALPKEFQRAFTPVERQQVIRVEFSSAEDTPPLFTKVTLHSPNVLPSWIKSASSNAFRSGFSFTRKASVSLFNLPQPVKVAMP